MSERVSGVLLVAIGLTAIGADRTWVLTIGGCCVLALGGLLSAFGSSRVG